MANNNVPLSRADINLLVKQHFPIAMPSSEAVAKVNIALEGCGCSPQNTLYGQSVCADEINHESGDITKMFTLRWGEVFHLGGLAGIPFTGAGGFGAYAHHITEGGNLFILYASHIGVSETGELGKYNRQGTGRIDAAGEVVPVKGMADATCGAACGALDHCFCIDKPINRPGQAFGDYQMEFIISQVYNHVAEFQQHRNNNNNNAMQAHLAYTISNISKAAMDLMMQYNGPLAAAPAAAPAVSEVKAASGSCETVLKPFNRAIYLLGGIQINMPYSMEDRFMPLVFHRFDQDTRVTTPLLDLTFGEGTTGAIAQTTWARSNQVVDLRRHTSRP